MEKRQTDRVTVLPSRELETQFMYSGESKLAFCKKLHGDWPKLAKIGLLVIIL